MNKSEASSHLDTGTLTALAVGDLPARQKQRAQAHLLTCAQCTQEFEQITQLWTTAKTPAAPVGSADAIRQSLLPHVAARSERKSMFFTLFTLPRLVVGIAGAVTVAASLWLTPGAPLRPLPAFADVKAAMQDLETATWTETAIYGDPGKKMSNAYFYGAQIKGDPVMFYRRYSLFDHNPTGSLTVSNRYGRYSPPETGQKGPQWTVWSRGNTVSRDIQEKLFFSPSAGEQESNRRKVARSDASYGYSWQWAPWQAQRTTWNGDLLVLFTSHAERRRNDGLQSTQKLDYTVYVNPETRRIVRMEERWYSGQDRGTLTVRDSFRYNVPLTEDITASLPPSDAQVGVMDSDLVGPNAPKATHREAVQAGQALSAFAKALSANRTTDLSQLIDTTVPVAVNQKLFSRTDEQRDAQLRSFVTSPQKRQLWNSFQFSRIIEVHYASRYVYERGTSSYPPPPLETSYEAITVAEGTTRDGKLLTCPARVRLRRVDGKLKITSTIFYPTHPAAEAEEWTSAGIHKSVREDIARMLRADKAGKGKELLSQVKKQPWRVDDGIAG